MFRLWGILLILLLVSSCKSIGPSEIHIDRGRYNDIVRETDNEMILKNIVRLRYVENTSFLKVSGVTSSYTLSNSLSASPNLSYSSTSGSPTSITRSLGFSPSVNFSDSPTISYAPAEDSYYVTALLSPITFEQLYYLRHGGVYDFSLITKLVYQFMTPLDNASAASSAKITSAPQYKEFYRLVRLINDMLEKNQAELYEMNINNYPGISIVFANNYANSPSARTIKKMLHVPLNAKRLLFSDHPPDSYNPTIQTNTTPTTATATATNNVPSEKTVYIGMRSTYGIMTFLSYGVQIPPEDLKANYVYEPRNPDGTLFDWSELMRGIISIKSSDEEPEDAVVFVKTRVHHHWFYIENSDVDSKATFSLLVRLITLTAGRSQSSNPPPILTLPAR